MFAQSAVAATNGLARLSLALLGMAVAVPTAGAAESALVDNVERLVSPYIENQVVVGLTVGILADDRQQVAGFGRLAIDQDRRPDGDTLYEIGSVTKALTGILLGDAVVRGEVTLQTSMREMLPEAPPGLPPSGLAKGDQPIRLLHLATHTSGLPRLPDDLNPADPANPYADYSGDRLERFLQSAEPRQVPGDQTEYSNLGMGALGYLLARRGNRSYEQLLAERLSGPLGMRSTVITLSDVLRQRLASPHSADGLPERNWDFQALAGAGGVRSSVNDMLRMLAAQIEPPEGPIGEAIELAWQVHRQPQAGEDFALGLGWHVAKDGQTRWHNGQSGGYHAMVLVNRASRVAVVVLANSATPEVDRLAEDLFRMASGVSVEPRVFTPVMEVSEEVMRRYVGRYSVVPGFDLQVTIDKGRLMVRATGQPAARIYPKSDVEWFYKVVDAQVTFQVDERGECHELTLHQNGRVLPARRVDQPEQ